jgi:hypothetical protein
MLLAREASKALPQTMTTYRAGQEIDAYCTRCKLDLTHKIVAVVGNKPVKVECRTCYGIHNFRLPRSAPAPAATTPRATPRARESSSVVRSARTAAETAPPLTPPDHAHIQLYKPADRFAVGSWISHKTFGLGVVLRELSPTKVEVRFDSDTKVLVHNAPPAA